MSFIPKEPDADMNRKERRGGDKKMKTLMH